MMPERKEKNEIKLMQIFQEVFTVLPSFYFLGNGKIFDALYRKTIVERLIILIFYLMAAARLSIGTGLCPPQLF